MVPLDFGDRPFIAKIPDVGENPEYELDEAPQPAGARG
jgi:hypothetical protein